MRPRLIRKHQIARDEWQTPNNQILKIVNSRDSWTTRADLQGNPLATLMKTSSAVLLQLMRPLDWRRSPVTPTHSMIRSWVAPRQILLRVRRCSDTTRFTTPLRYLMWGQHSRRVSYILRFPRGQPAPEGPIIHTNQSQRSPSKETLMSQWRRWRPRRNLPGAKM